MRGIGLDGGGGVQQWAEGGGRDRVRSRGMNVDISNIDVSTVSAQLLVHADVIAGGRHQAMTFH